MLYLFDVDKTLAPSYQMMQEGMANIFREWCEGKKFFFISGSPLDKMRTQVPDDLMAKATGWFPQLGGEFYFQGQHKYTKDFEWPEGLREDLEAFIEDSLYEVRAGNHIEDRGTMVNFSVVGRACSLEQRADYHNWDNKNQERAYIAEKLREAYPDLNFVIGGEISIDISGKGNDKAQALPVLREIYGNEPLMFFGDKMMAGGNDFPLGDAMRLEEGVDNQPMPVKDPEHTRQLLGELLSAEKKAD